MILKFLIIVLLFVTEILCSQSNENMSNYQKTVKETDKTYDETIKIRRDSHINSEVDEQEKEPLKLLLNT